MQPYLGPGRSPAPTAAWRFRRSSAGWRDGELALSAALDELDTATVELDPQLLVNVNTRG